MDNQNAPSSFDYFGKTPKGVEMALHLNLDPLIQNVEQLQDLADILHGFDIALYQKGFTRSDRLDKPARGGGGGGGAFKRPEATPPPDLKVPEHCGQPMIYKPGYDKPDGSKVNAKFTCRADKECAVVKAGGQWPATEWEDALRRKLRSAAPRTDDFPTDEDYA